MYDLPKTYGTQNMNPEQIQILKRVKGYIIHFSRRNFLKMLMIKKIS